MSLMGIFVGMIIVWVIRFIKIRKFVLKSVDVVRIMWLLDFMMSCIRWGMMRLMKLIILDIVIVVFMVSVMKNMVCWVSVLGFMFKWCVLLVFRRYVFKGWVRCIK